MASLLLKDVNGNYFPVVVDYLKPHSSTKEGMVWVAGVTKKILEEIGLKIFDIIQVEGHYQYAYLIDEQEYLTYLVRIQPPIILERF